MIDSLIRLGLATPDQVRLTTFDLSPRINHHLEAARQRASAGGEYVLELPRTMDPPWTPSLVAYWERLGDRIGVAGEAAKAVAVPPSAGRVQVRAVRVRPAVVMSIVPQDLNIVLQRLELLPPQRPGPGSPRRTPAPRGGGVRAGDPGLPADERFDLIIATNVLAYYSVFEQSLALVNVAKMMRPGGMFLTNNGVFELPPIPMAWVGDTDVTYMNLPGIGQTIDRLFWYRRQ